jgi:mono/diheme cytochrome c family protein
MVGHELPQEETMNHDQSNMPGRGVRVRTVMTVAVVAALFLGACGSSSAPAVPESSDPAVIHGKELTSQSCAACHGVDFNGVKNSGPSFFDNGFIQEQSDSDLIAFIKLGRPNNAPDNETGVAMPMYGGNPQLSDGDLADIVAFLRLLQE